MCLYPQISGCTWVVLSARLCWFVWFSSSSLSNTSLNRRCAPHHQLFIILMFSVTPRWTPLHDQTVWSTPLFSSEKNLIRTLRESVHMTQMNKPQHFIHLFRQQESNRYHSDQIHSNRCVDYLERLIYQGSSCSMLFINCTLGTSLIWHMLTWSLKDEYDLSLLGTLADFIYAKSTIFGLVWGFQFYKNCRWSLGLNLLIFNSWINLCIRYTCVKTNYFSPLI